MKTENHRVLIIDDERPVLMTLEALLKRHGYQVETAPTAAQGLKVLKSKSPTLVLLDLRLPDADGLDVSLRELVVEQCAGGGPGETADIFAAVHAELVDHAAWCSALRAGLARAERELATAAARLAGSPR